MPKVLIVEDDPLISRMYQKIFTFEQFEVDVAPNGEEALAKVSIFKPELILLDVMMPKMNGLQVIKSEYEPKQVVDMVKEVLAGYTRNEIPSTAAPAA
jgi:DNA-binding response OmpR family regulator